MNDELTQKLLEAYPRLYRGRNESLKTNLMPFGFECGDGWYGVLEALSKDLANISRIWGIDIKAVQVKEKFGTLRFYHDIRFTDEWTVRVNTVVAWLTGPFRMWCIDRHRYAMCSRLRVFDTLNWLTDRYKYRYERRTKYDRSPFTGEGEIERVHQYTQQEVTELIYDVVRRHIDYAEWVTQHICEVCGRWGAEPDNGGWIRNVCPQHKRKVDNKG